MFILSNQQFKQLQSYLDSIQSVLNQSRQSDANLLGNPTHAIPSRPMTKAELASLLNKSPRQLSRWIEPFRSQLREMGVSDRAKMLPPNAVALICQELDITFDEKMM